MEINHYYCSNRKYGYDVGCIGQEGTSIDRLNYVWCNYNKDNPFRCKGIDVYPVSEDVEDVILIKLFDI